MRIELHEIRDPLEICCPSCGSPALLVSKHSESVVGGGYWLHDGDALDFDKDLTPEQRQPSGYLCELLQGSRPCCNCGYIVIEAILTNAPMNEEFANSYMAFNVAVGPYTNFLATRGGERWIMRRYNQTPLGPMLVHDFGPFAWPDTSWIGPYGVANCGEEPWIFANAFLLERWDDLQAITRSLPVPNSAAEYLRTNTTSPKTCEI